MANDNEMSLEELLKQDEQAKRESDARQQKIRQARQASATKNFDQVVELLRANAQFFSLIQRNTIMRMVKGDESGGGKRDRGESRTPKFQLDNGLAWSGHGKKTKGFDDWAASAEGKKWQAANPGQKFPSYPNHNASGGGQKKPSAKPASRAKPVAKKAVAKKATKKK